jgi:hypothetical protein
MNSLRIDDRYFRIANGPLIWGLFCCKIMIVRRGAPLAHAHCGCGAGRIRFNRGCVGEGSSCWDHRSEASRQNHRSRQRRWHFVVACDPGVEGWARRGRYQFREGCQREELIVAVRRYEPWLKYVCTMQYNKAKQYSMIVMCADASFTLTGCGVSRIWVVIIPHHWSCRHSEGS